MTTLTTPDYFYPAQLLRIFFKLVDVIKNPSHDMMKPFFVYQNRSLIKISPKDIVCLVSEDNYTKIFLANDTQHIVRSTLAAALKKLPVEIFIRIHRSVVVNIFYIDSIDRDHLILNKKSVPIGKQYYKSLISRLDIIE